MSNQLRPIQEEINRVYSQITRSQQTLGDNQLLIQARSDLNFMNASPEPGVRAINYTGPPPQVEVRNPYRTTTNWARVANEALSAIRLQGSAQPEQVIMSHQQYDALSEATSQSMSQYIDSSMANMRDRLASQLYGTGGMAAAQATVEREMSKRPYDPKEDLELQTNLRRIEAMHA